MSIVAKGLPQFQVYYDEKLEVGYKSYDAQKKAVLFPFGFGLSHTSYEYSDLTVKPGSPISVSFTVKTSGKNAGTEIAEVYAALPESAGEPPKRLIGWARVNLAPGESKHVSVPIDNDRLTIDSETSDSWTLLSGEYKIMVGGSSQSLDLQREITLKELAADLLRKVPGCRDFAGRICTSLSYVFSADRGTFWRREWDSSPNFRKANK